MFQLVKSCEIMVNHGKFHILVGEVIVFNRQSLELPRHVASLATRTCAMSPVLVGMPRSLRGDHWGLSQFKGPALMWEQNLKQSKTWEFFCYWHPSFNVPFHLWDVKAMVGVFELIHSIPKRFWASNKVGFFGSSYGYACSLVLWLILSLETTPPLNKQVQH